MTTPELLQFVRDQVKLGVNKDALTNMLIGQGWNLADINEAFFNISQIPQPSVPDIKSTTPPPVTPVPTMAARYMPKSTENPPIVPPITPSITPKQTENVTTPTFVTSQPQKQPVQSPKIFSIIIIILVIVCVGALGAYGYFTFLAPQQNPTDILKKSLSLTFGQTNSVSFVGTTTGQVTASSIASSSYSSDFTLTGNGAFDYSNRTNPLVQFDINVNANVISGTSTTANILLAISNIVADKTVFARINNFLITLKSSDPDQAQLQMLVAMVNGFAGPLENKWIKLATSTSLTTASSSQNSLSTEDIALIKSYITGMSYIKSISNTGDEVLNGINVHHLKLQLLDNGELPDLIQKISTEKDKSIVNSDSYKEQMANFKKQLAQEIDFDLWIGKDDSRLYRIVSMPFTYDDNQNSVKSHTIFELTFSGYNQPKSILAPTDAVTLQSIMEQIFGGMFNNTSSKGSGSKSTSPTFK